MGAEAVALALAGSRLGWRVKRRLQSTNNEGADWLMHDGTGGTWIVEVSGLDDGPLIPRLRQKQAQARESIYADVWPCPGLMDRLVMLPEQRYVDENLRSRLG